MTYSCCNENRKAAALRSPGINGIDYLEVLDSEAAALGSVRQRTLLVHCLKAVSSGIGAANVLIQGGESITNIGIEWAAPASEPPPLATPTEQAYFAGLTDAPKVLVVRTTVAGDFSPYTLRLVNNASAAQQDPFQVTEVLTGFDLQLAVVTFSFKVECGPDFDCAPPTPTCNPAPPAPPPINYLAKDYGSFRTVMLDRLSQLIPSWGGTSEADLGVALAELISYVGDNLSYRQDAIATDAYLETARSRISLRRHALLVDYHVSDGCNARAWMQLQVSGNPGDQIFLDRTLTRFYTYAPGMPSSLAVGAGNEEAALLTGVQVFEPVFDAVLYPEHDQISFYTWGDTACCLPKGATEATLLGSFPNLQPGDVLIFQEMKGPLTGDPADADMRHRCAVCLTQVATQNAAGQPLVDTLFLDANGNPAAVTEIQWAQADALPFPVCISSTYLDSNGDLQSVSDVSAVFGNIVLADHGLSLSGISLGSMPAPTLYYPPDPSGRCQNVPPVPLAVRFQPQVPDSPLTQAVPVPAVTLPLAGTTTELSGGSVTLNDSDGSVVLELRPTNPLNWPVSFGVLASVNTAHSSDFDLSVVYDPTGGPAGIGTPVTVEKFTDLSINPADPNYVAKVINGNSKLIQVPASYVPPATPATGFPSTPTGLANTGTATLKDSGGISYLTLQANNPAAWPAYLSIFAQASPNPAKFNLQVAYSPSSGSVGVLIPVTVESFIYLSLGTLTSQIAPSKLIEVASFAQTATASIQTVASEAVPAITLAGTFDGIATTWTPVPDLLESGESDAAFVVEVESDGTATLRFGDNTNGKTPDQGTSFVASYRIGNGAAGNVGADSLVYLAVADARITACRNPLPASGGTDPETNDQIRRRAPQAFLTQERAVTMADYAAVTEMNPQVEQAVANLRWTGSWYTVFIAVEPQGGGNLTPALQRALKANVNRYRLAGQDLELDSPQYVSLQIELSICVDPNYFQADVEQMLLQVLGNQILSNGQKGFFFPDNFTFGQTVYLSPIYAAARSVPGVVTVRAVTFQPQGVNTSVYLTAGEIQLGSLQVARLDNDPNYPDHGQLTLDMEGGK